MYIKDSEYRNRISTFCKKTISKKYYPHYLYYKLHGLTIKKPKLAGILPVSSNYDAKNNIVTLVDEDDLEFMLMQVVSTDYHTPIYSGFSIGKLGNGLNNGYTNLLVKRYFNKSKESYPIEMKIAFNIEQIVTKKLMEQLYFKADLNGLINELSKYSSKQQVVDLINSIDYINKRVNYDRTKSNHERFIIHKVKEINLFLLNCYINKLTIEFKNNQISLNEFYENLKNYSKNLKYVMNPFEEKYCILTYKNIDDSIKKHIKLLHI